MVRGSPWALGLEYRHLELLKDPIALFSTPWLVDRFNVHAVVMIRHPAAYVSSVSRLGWRFDFGYLLGQDLLMRDLLDLTGVVASFGGPLLVCVGDRDEIVSVDEARELAEKALPWLETKYVESVPEGQALPVIDRLVTKDHCKVVFTTSFGLEGGLDPAAFEAACRAIPGLAAWTDPDRASPVTDVLPGGPLHNDYRGQQGRDGRPCIPGLVSVGDAVATTTPIFTNADR